MRNTKHFASIPLLILIVGLSIAHGQTPTSNTPQGREVQLTNLLARASGARWPTFSLMPVRNDVNATSPLFNSTPMAAGPNLTVLGGGTLGRLTKWVGFTSSNSFIGDSTIFEDKYGLVGIGTDSPTSKLTVNGIIQSLAGGFKFPDGTVQSSSAAGALFTVTHDATLTGSGTSASPLGVASPLEVRDRDNPARQPIQVDGSCQPFQGGGGCDGVILTVPAGKRLVIEYVSVDSQTVAVGEVAFFEIYTTINNGNPVFHRLPMSQPAAAFGHQGGRVTVGQQVRIYADPGTTVHGSWLKSLSNFQADASFRNLGLLCGYTLMRSAQM